MGIAPAQAAQQQAPQQQQPQQPQALDNISKIKSLMVPLRESLSVRFYLYIQIPTVLIYNIP